MKQVSYKYKVGDTIKFKDKFHPSASCGLEALAGTTAKVVAQEWWAKPCYRLEGHDSLYTEKCFSGLA